MSHTKGKLSYAHRERADGTYSTELFDASGKTVAEASWYSVKTDTGYKTNREENARRLVACWNACDGVPTEGLEMYDVKNIELKQERDELISWLAVCDDLLKEYAPKYDGCSTEERIAEILARYETK